MFKGLGQMGDMGKMLKAAQEMQGKMAALTEELHRITVTGEAGAGLVKATCTAKGELTTLSIDPSISRTRRNARRRRQRRRWASSPPRWACRPT